MLKSIGHLVADNMGDNEFFGRYGPGEFVLLLPGVDRTDAPMAADGLCDDARNCGFHSPGNAMSITVSGGVPTICDD